MLLEQFFLRIGHHDARLTFTSSEHRNVLIHKACRLAASRSPHDKCMQLTCSNNLYLSALLLCADNDAVLVFAHRVKIRHRKLAQFSEPFHRQPFCIFQIVLAQSNILRVHPVHKQERNHDQSVCHAHRKPIIFVRQNLCYFTRAAKSEEIHNDSAYKQKDNHPKHNP